MFYRGIYQCQGPYEVVKLPTIGGASSRAKLVPITVNPQVLPGLARSVSSSLQFSFSGCSIYGRSHICYRYVQNINFGTSFSLLVSLAAFILKTRRDMLPATS